VPGLAIPGAIGIQLAELNASLVATGAFVVLIALAVLLQRPRLRGRLLHTLSRGRTKAPTPEDDY
jgi:hypothetical protein